jgi:hypothetical protein
MDGIRVSIARRVADCEPTTRPIGRRLLALSSTIVMTAGMRTRAILSAIAIAALSACVVFDPRYTDPPAETYSVKRFDVAVAGGEPAAVEGAEVSGDFFRAAQAQPLLGRFFVEPDQQGSTRVAVISHRWWSERFGSSPETIGKDIRVDNMHTVIIGVGPPRFDVPPGVSIWLPRNTR